VPELTGTAFNLFPADMWLRRRVYCLVSHRRFDNFMLFCIFLSCCAMVYEHPDLQPGAVDTRILYWLDIGLTAFFSAECLLKMFAYCVRRYLAENSNKVRCRRCSLSSCSCQVHVSVCRGAVFAGSVQTVLNNAPGRCRHSPV
jgi:hypothetical protein